MNLSPAFAIVANMGVHFPETGSNLREVDTSPREGDGDVTAAHNDSGGVEGHAVFPKRESSHRPRGNQKKIDGWQATCKPLGGNQRVIDPSTVGKTTSRNQVRPAVTSFPFGRFFEIDCRLCLKPYSGYLPECPHCTHPQLVLE